MSELNDNMGGCDGISVATVPAPGEASPSGSRSRRHSYSHILKSSALIGGSSVFKIGLGIIRTKAMAALLGPAGFGLLGLYGSIVDLTQSIASMGINSSGVRQIAEAVGSGETARIAQTATVLRRTAGVLGTLGALLLLLFSRQISFLTFGTYERTGAVALLSIAVWCGSITSGQSALIQGMRRISDLAMMGVLGALFGTIISIPLVYFFGVNGVVPSLIAVAATGILTSWWYSRKTGVPSVRMNASQVRHGAAALLKLGFAFMASGFLMMGAAYVIRILVTRKLGLEAAGFYQSAWTLGGLYVGFILQAMGADFYPRLTAVCRDNHECNRLVNEQAQVSLLLAGPGVLGTLTFAPLVIALFYSAKFGAAVDVLRWLCVGTILQVIAWPMGFIVIAKGAQKTFFWTELAAAVVQVGLAWVLVERWGLSGAGAAFFGLYVWHGLLIYAIVRRLTGFRWSAENRKIGSLFLSLVGAVFLGCYVLPFWAATTFGAMATVASGLYSVRALLHLSSIERLPKRLRSVLARFRLGPAE